MVNTEREESKRKRESEMQPHTDQGSPAATGVEVEAERYGVDKRRSGGGHVTTGQEQDVSAGD